MVLNDKVSDPRLLRAVSYWRDKAGVRPYPDRRDIDPIEIADLLPWIVLWDVLPGGGYRCRLAGTGTCEAHGRDVTGELMHDFHSTANALIQPEYDAVARTGEPHYAERTLFWLNRKYRGYRRVLLPLSNGGADVAIIMNVARFLKLENG